MVEKFLVDLFRRTQKQKIAIVVDGSIVSQTVIEVLPSLVEKLREIGDIKVAEVISDSKIPDKDYEYLTQAGFTNKVVASNLELNLLSQTYDMILSDKSIDTLVLGTENDNLIPLVTELRKNVTIFALTGKPISKAFEESFDGIIDATNIDDFQFTTSDLSEIESIIGTGDANISPMSDDLEEQSDLDEELKIQEIRKNGEKSKSKPAKTNNDDISTDESTEKTKKKVTTKKKTTKKATKKSE
ncbi:MAG: hypothetical protein ACXAC2_17930 [Candidatus Kariarchaeaceae archaeon]